jgi:acyl carrier protein
MPDAKERVARCFVAVFPEIDEKGISAASMDSIEAWDSLRTITLVNVIEEEFHIQVDPDDLELLVSYDSILDYLRRKGAIP